MKYTPGQRFARMSWMGCERPATWATSKEYLPGLPLRLTPTLQPRVTLVLLSVQMKAREESTHL